MEHVGILNSGYSGKIHLANTYVRPGSNLLQILDGGLLMLSIVQGRIAREFDAPHVSRISL